MVYSFHGQSNIVVFFFFLLPEEFENLGKAFSKAKTVVDKEGIPQFYIRCLTELEDFVKEVSNFNVLGMQIGLWSLL